MSLRPTCAPHEATLTIKWHPILKTPTPNQTKPSQANKQNPPQYYACGQDGESPVPAEAGQALLLPGKHRLFRRLDRLNPPAPSCLALLHHAFCIL